MDVKISQEIAAIGYFQANSIPTAHKILNHYASGVSNVLGISGCESIFSALFINHPLGTDFPLYTYPFSAPLRITNIQANITSNGFFVGTITTDPDFTSQGHVGTTSPSLDL